MRRFFNSLPLGLLVALCVFMPTNTFGQDSSGINKSSNDSTQANVYLTQDTNSIKPLYDSLKSNGSKINYWGTVGLCNIGGIVEMNLGINKHLFSCQYIDYKGRYSSNWDDPPVPARKEYSLLYGRILANSKRKFYSSVSAGISRMFYDNAYFDNSVYGCPIMYKIMYCRKYFGIGCDLVANINSNSDYLVLFLHISLGKLK